jgi:hypothetical protein
MDFTLVSFAATLLLRFYAFTALPLFPAHAMHTEHEFTNLLFYIVFHSLAHAFHDLRFFNAEIQDLLLNYTF